MDDLPEDNVPETAKLLRETQRADFRALLGGAVAHGEVSGPDLEKLTVAERLAIGDRAIRALRAQGARTSPLAVLDALETLLDTDAQSKDQTSFLMAHLVALR